MSWMDWALIVLLASFAVHGLMEGLIRQLAGLVGFLAGLILASVLYRGLAARLSLSFDSAIALEPLIFVTILLGVWILANLVGIVSRKRSRDEDSNWPDDLGGALLGLVSGVLMLAILSAGVVQLGIPIGKEIQASQVGTWLLGIAECASRILSGWIAVP